MERVLQPEEEKEATDRKPDITKGHADSERETLVLTYRVES